MFWAVVGGEEIRLLGGCVLVASLGVHGEDIDGLAEAAEVREEIGELISEVRVAGMEVLACTARKQGFGD